MNWIRIRIRIRTWIRIRNYEKSKLDPDQDPEHIIPDPQHCINLQYAAR